jgi:hypothetical protein
MAKPEYPKPSRVSTLSLLAAALLMAFSVSPTGAQLLGGTGGLTAAGPWSVMTAVTEDGALWAATSPDEAVLLADDLAAGGAVTSIAWNPTRPEILLVRRVFREESGARAPYDSLVRRDLLTDDEEVLLENVGPQARLVQPRYAPDGSWAYVNTWCCLARQMTFFEETAQRHVATVALIDPTLRDVALAEAGPIAADGSIVVRATCCVDQANGQPPFGIYLAGREPGQSRRVSPVESLVPFGLGGGQAWIAATRADLPRGVVILDLANGAEHALEVGDGDAATGDVAPDGEIAVGIAVDGFDPVQPRYREIRALMVDGSNLHNAMEDAPGPYTAFGWAPMTQVAPAMPRG